MKEQIIKEQIIETSLKHFLADGIRSNTMQKLAAAMGISTKTMYKFFVDKEALLEECLKIHYKGAGNELLDLIDGTANPIVSLWNIYSKTVELDFGVNHAFYHDLNYYYPELQDKIIKQYVSNTTTIITGIIKQGIEEGYFLSYLQPSVVMEVSAVLYASVTRYNSYEKSGLKPEDLFNHTTTIYLRGICTDKGLKVMNQLNELTN
ncbi:MAG TPA: TetR/AcrR family transcriptional regulator [Mucilaginibacter sp.]|jgi:AcrR family transcriptional regulator